MKPYILLLSLLLSQFTWAQASLLTLTVGEAKQKSKVASGNDYSARDMSLGLQFEYQWLDYFALDVGYTDYGKAQKRHADNRAAMRLSAIDTGVKLIYPVTSHFDMYARLGVAWWDYEIKLESQTPLIQDKLSKKDRDFYYGLGLRMRLNDVFLVGLEYQRFTLDMDKRSVDIKHSVDNAALTLALKF